jgi:hypothetical protein
MPNETPNKGGCFWVVVTYTLLGTFCVLCGVGSGRRRYERSLAEEIIYGLVLVTLTTVVWAICFRPQLEACRVSLAAIFALVTMLAVLFSAFRFFDPLGIYPG